MSAVFHDGAAKGAAELVPAVLRLFEARILHGEVLLLVSEFGQRLVAEEPEGASREVVGSRLGHHGHEPAGREPVLRLEVAGRDLELADGVHREVLARLAHLGPGVVHPVHDEGVRVVAAAGAHVHVAPVVVAADRVLAGARSEQREVHPSGARPPGDPGSGGRRPRWKCPNAGCRAAARFPSR